MLKTNNQVIEDLIMEISQHVMYASAEEYLIVRVTMDH